MGKRLLVSFAVLLFAASLTVAGAKDKKEGSWVGWVTDTHCGAKGANANHAACAKKCVETQGAKYALYTPSDKKIYILEPQEKAADQAGHHVKVTGTVEGDTIQVKSIEVTGEQTGKMK